MKRPNLKTMPLDDLIALREQIDVHFATVRKGLADQLAKLGGQMSDRAVRRKRSSSLKGRKVPPKYRNPKNRRETWAGRGATPRWLQAFLKQGKKLQDFAIQR